MSSSSFHLQTFFSSLTTEQIAILVASLLIFLGSIIGNSLVILTLWRHKGMRTVTNVYLLNISLTDLLLTIFCLPLTVIGLVLRRFVFGALLCRIMPFLQATSVSANMWTMVALSLERYFAIRHPLRSKRCQTTQRAFKVNAIIWLSSGIIMSPLIHINRLVRINYHMATDLTSYEPYFNRTRINLLAFNHDFDHHESNQMSGNNYTADAKLFKPQSVDLTFSDNIDMEAHYITYNSTHFEGPYVYPIHKPHKISPFSEDLGSPGLKLQPNTRFDRNLSKDWQNNPNKSLLHVQISKFPKIYHIQSIIACREHWPSVTRALIFNWFINVTLFIIPLIFMSIAYFKIGYCLVKGIGNRRNTAMLKSPPNLSRFTSFSSRAGTNPYRSRLLKNLKYRSFGCSTNANTSFETTTTQLQRSELPLLESNEGNADLDTNEQVINEPDRIVDNVTGKPLQQITSRMSLTINESVLMKLKQHLWQYNKDKIEREDSHSKTKYPLGDCTSKHKLVNLWRRPLTSISSRQNSSKIKESYNVPQNTFADVHASSHANVSDIETCREITTHFSNDVMKVRSTMPSKKSSLKVYDTHETSLSKGDMLGILYPLYYHYQRASMDASENNKFKNRRIQLLKSKKYPVPFGQATKEGKRRSANKDVANDDKIRGNSFTKKYPNYRMESSRSLTSTSSAGSSMRCDFNQIKTRKLVHSTQRQHSLGNFNRWGRNYILNNIFQGFCNRQKNVTDAVRSENNGRSGSGRNQHTSTYSYGRETSARHERERQSEAAKCLKVVRMLLVIVFEFFVCWTPVYLVNTWVTHDSHSFHFGAGALISRHIYVIHMLAYVSCALNPFTYCFMNRRFRMCFKEAILQGLCFQSIRRRKSLGCLNNPQTSEAHRMRQIGRMSSVEVGGGAMGTKIER